jgi:hypothetical protein
MCNHVLIAIAHPQNLAHCYLVVLQPRALDYLNLYNFHIVDTIRRM